MPAPKPSLQSVLLSIQKDAIKIGDMPSLTTQNSAKPSMILLYDFYNFYSSKRPVSVETEFDRKLTLVCDKFLAHILEVVDFHYSINRNSFLTNLEDWNEVSFFMNRK